MDSENGVASKTGPAELRLCLRAGGRSSTESFCPTGDAERCLFGHTLVGSRSSWMTSASPPRVDRVCFRVLLLGRFRDSRREWVLGSVILFLRFWFRMATFRECPSSSCLVAPPLLHIYVSRCPRDFHLRGFGALKVHIFHRDVWGERGFPLIFAAAPRPAFWRERAPRRRPSGARLRPFYPTVQFPGDHYTKPTTAAFLKNVLLTVPFHTSPSTNPSSTYSDKVTFEMVLGDSSACFTQKCLHSRVLSHL